MRLLPAVALVVALSGADAGAQGAPDGALDERVTIAPDDADMAAAVRTARATLPQFLALARAPKPQARAFALKVGINVGGRREYVWVRPFAPKGDRYSGTLRSTPRGARNLNYGDAITFKLDDVVDWSYVDGRVTRGHFTLCAQARRESRQHAEAFMRQFGVACEP